MLSIGLRGEPAKKLLSKTGGKGGENFLAIHCIPHLNKDKLTIFVLNQRTNIHLNEITYF